MADLQKLMAKWGKKDAPAKEQPDQGRAGRRRRRAAKLALLEAKRRQQLLIDPPAVEVGSRCQRCSEWTHNIACAYDTYWICPKCFKFFVALERWTERMREFNNGPQEINGAR